ncbi:MAG TPA: hypothetical protein VMZ69_02055 [Saprospiraceae bacterium]|nr:hypothetical protein [Saprospiraceae bacterium]
MTKKAELVGSYFGTIYLTVISLLQGIVLSQLVPNLIAYSKLAENPWTDYRLLPFILMLLIIFVVWHHYAIGIFFLRWFPNIIDTIIPFVVSIVQFFLLSYLSIQNSVSDIDMYAWTKGFALILISGCLAYFGASWRLEAALFTNIMSLQNAEMHLALSKKVYNFGGISVLVQGLFAVLIVVLHKEEWLLISLILLVLHIVISEYLLLKTVKPHFVRAMDEFDAHLKL